MGPKLIKTHRYWENSKKDKRNNNTYIKVVLLKEIYIYIYL